ncbi:putative WRKY transcription factor 3 [Hibiscus syriacus]|uniref:WRKY transcription factor 3 n=1 Tax=Hibiscus syriacus TaxID=106335 RepID=A0A6A3BWU8_HIBSY|nr:putative WRKY transcription factor 3 [Hibiscus syriacus]
MDKSQEQKPSAQPSKAVVAAASRPIITPPPRPFTEASFNGGAGMMGFSPGPMTLVSNFFSESDEFKSFSQLLAGAMASPAAGKRPNFPPVTTTEGKGGVAGSGGGDDTGLRFRQNKPAGLVIAQPPVPTGLSPASLLESPGFSVFSPGPQGPFRMTHQQALTQVTVQAHSLAPAATSASVASVTMNQQMSHDSTFTVKETSDACQSDHGSQPASFVVDKPADDEYNWRKYGQKQVKGSEFPRSYYKCTNSGCQVKKKVERSIDGQVTEIIYKGQHNHQPPPLNKRGKDTRSLNGLAGNQGNSESASQLQSGNSNIVMYKDQESSQATRTNDNEEAGMISSTNFFLYMQKYRNQVKDPASSHRTVTEPRIIVQTTSEVDLLDDGYRWRKYGQKVVKGNPHPRSYYKCTTPGCNVRKHVERASTDPKAVITTYEGKHNHDVPAAKTRSHDTANSNASHARMQNLLSERHSRQPVARLRLKEEQIT